MLYISVEAVSGEIPLSLVGMDVIDSYYDYIMDNTELFDDAKKELRGKDLVCFCKPKACHGDILLKIANE
jgi:hypothetical protein